MSLASAIHDGQFHCVVILSGAGVSTNSGIPDYRSSAGWYSQITPEMFNDPTCYRERRPMLKKMFDAATPGASHRLAAWLHERGWLRRVFTQNIDGLYQRAGLPQDKVVEAHGNLDRDDVVLYGCRLSSEFYDAVVRDFCIPTKLVHEFGKDWMPPDLVLVMGTTLQVAPFCALPNLARPYCPRAWICRDPPLTNDFERWETIAFGKRRVKLKLNFFDKKGRAAKQRPFDLVCNTDLTAFSDACMCDAMIV
jgi:NAD-dependent SIR2 family protein deacetylase